ncbi:Plasmodium exported protein (PHIST), unknown function [Plasmodium ovale wallikeri]|uniref:Plasmodium RESA N-terminal domain-containing protein n=1 Tax=Plasmodium ovale wallikeri TaxID=864142 RepID=A0A1A8YPJ5_PLAOA|nr:Phist protein (Pf-fam-b), unknown function [Plasmodium ovale wallikeri]SBT33533.1 Plasmodium exported protein (PHIST), unknown function [Plasmodium ovale wallikeri]
MYKDSEKNLKNYSFIKYNGIFTPERSSSGVTLNSRQSSRFSRSLNEWMMRTFRGNLVNQKEFSRKTKNVYLTKCTPEETPEQFVERVCNLLQFTDELRDKLNTCGPNIPKKSMCFNYKKLYEGHRTNFVTLIEAMQALTEIMAKHYGRNEEFKVKCWRKLFKDLQKNLIRISDYEDDGGLCKFLNGRKSCKTEEFVNFLTQRIDFWNQYITTQKTEKFNQLKKYMESGVIS